MYEFSDLELNEARDFVLELHNSKTINFHYAEILLKALNFLQKTRTRHQDKRRICITFVSMFLGMLTYRLIAG
jgi:hypothetical protein